MKLITTYFLDAIYFSESADPVHDICDLLGALHFCTVTILLKTSFVLMGHVFQCFASALTVLRIFRHRCRHSIRMPRQTRHQNERV